MPRPKGSVNRPYKSPEELRGKMEEYFRDMEAQDEFPDEAGMRLALNCGHEVWQAYQEDEAYRKVMDWAVDMRESWLSRALLRNPRNAQAYLNALKQPKNGGWVDRKTDSGDRTLRLKIDGVGGEEAFR